MNGSLTVIVVYVDEILAVGDDLAEITSLKYFLDAEFKIKDLGEIHYFLGLEIVRQSSGFFMNQHKFCLDLLSEFNCSVVSPMVAPLDPHLKLSADMGELLLDASLYRRLVGKLNYLQHTNTDLSYIVQHLSQFTSSPRVPYLDVALHVLRHLSGTRTLGLFLSANSDFV